MAGHLAENRQHEDHEAGYSWVGELILRGNNNDVGQAIHHHLQLLPKIPRLTESVCPKPLGALSLNQPGTPQTSTVTKANYLHPGSPTNSS